MLSRIQNLYLFLAGVLAILSMLFPIWSFSTGKVYVVADFRPYADAGIIEVAASYGSIVFSVLTAITSFAAIFLFKNRKLQQKLVLLAIAFFAGDLFSGLTAAHFMNEYFKCTCINATHGPEAGFFLILPEPVLFWLALGGIKKDDKIANAYKRL